MEKLQQIKAVIAEAEIEAAKFEEKGNASAGTRLRKKMQDIKVLAQSVREEVSAKKHA